MPTYGGNTLSTRERWHQETSADTISSGRYSKLSEPHMPTNPFKKTVATLETEVITEETSFREDSPKLNKSQYNVDDFKRLLMTGERPPSISTTDSTIHSQPTPGDNSSNTDTSVSGKSVLEPATYSDYDSSHTSQDYTFSGDERQSLVATSVPKVEKCKPATPKHRHGKLVKPNDPPQTVPFEDPAFTLSGGASRTSTFPEQLTPTNDVSQDDVRQPFPALSKFEETKAETPEPASRNISSQAQKKLPPAPPASRRHGQLRPKSFVVDSGRSSPISEDVYAEPLAYSSSPPSSISRPTPPPPRRSGASRQDSSTSLPTSATTVASSGQSASTSMPPATPPTRSPSLNATRRLPQSSSQSGSPSMPPPPPPRRRGSSQSSYTPSRLSGDYRALIGQRPRGDSGASSISQLQMTPVESNPEKKDVLADLSALQREVDELRGKMRD